MTIDISGWHWLNSLEKAQIEMDAYEHILMLLIDDGVSADNEHFQYYEKLYLKAYFNLFDIKNNFSSYLMNEVTHTPKINWEIDFIKKEVIIYE